MEENNALTKREIFEQIKILQKELAGSPFLSLNALAGAAEKLRESDEANDDISELCTVFAMREENIGKMLKFYEKLYDDIAEE